MNAFRSRPRPAARRTPALNWRNMAAGSTFVGLLGLCAAGSCGPDNVGACNAAEAKVIAAYEACDVDRADETSFGCDLYIQTSYDCTDYFAGAEESAACVDGEVTWAYSVPCAAWHALEPSSCSVSAKAGRTNIGSISTSAKVRSAL